MARPKELQDQKRLFVRMPGELHEQAMKKAEKKDKTLSEVVRSLLTGWIREEDPKEIK